MNYDIVAGMDQPTLNTLISQVYTVLYPSLLRDTISVGQMGMASVAFDINASPTVNLTPSGQGRDYLSTAIENSEFASKISEDDKAKILELATAATFELVASSVALTVNYTNGATPVTVVVSLTASVNIQAGTSGGNNSLTVHILTATLAIPSEPMLEGLLNNCFVPLLIPYLNKNILSAIQIPDLQYKSLQVSLPVPVVQGPDFITAYSALGATQPDIPAPSQFQPNCVFVGVDVPFIMAAIGTEISFPLGPSTGFSWGPVKGSVAAQVLAPSITINGEGGITATAAAKAYAKLTLHTPGPFPNVSFGPTATATLTPTFTPSVSNGQVFITHVSSKIPTFSFDWGIPSWINWFFEPIEYGLAAALNAVIGPLIKAAFSNIPAIELFTLPTISINLAGKKINISINQATTSNQNNMLMVAAQVTVS